MNFFVETVAKTGMILVCGEITSKAVVDYQAVIRDTIKKIGYDDSDKGQCFFFHQLLCVLITKTTQKSPFYGLLFSFASQHNLV